MFDLIMRSLLALAYMTCGIGFTLALGTTIYAIYKERINILEALTFFTMVFFRWPEIACDYLADEIRIWWNEHINWKREER